MEVSGRFLKKNKMSNKQRVEVYINEFTGEIETPEKTLKVIDNMIASGHSDNALLYIDSLLILAIEKNDLALLKALEGKKNKIKFPFKFVPYKETGAADEDNTLPETARKLPAGTPVIFKENLNPDKIYEALFSLRAKGQAVSGIPFWFVVYNFFESIGWLAPAPNGENPKQTKFIAWVRHCFGWEWKRKDFKRINPRFKKHFEEWPEENQTDKNYCALSSELRSTYQQPKPDGDWGDKDIYYKKNRIHYN